MTPIYWLVFFIIFVVIEIISLGLTTIWFAGGALVGFVAALLGATLPVQIILFFAVSILLLFVTRPIAVRYLKSKKVNTNIDSLVGQTAIVTQTINNLQAQGTVSLNGQEWTARSQEDSKIIEEGKKVTIIQISGVKLIVKVRED
ncbi:NfeD family protein [Anaerosacchariphilus polymeriproducens]|uniref:NfeD family protein n=1 Tax=Anaerosacchariphilus polymeriproducens TaxID=1812858 RepID=A0A371AX86_9FIRM|nr:NfeD family protein [Anaerosacchariphilus polymeriproducens]RDU24194.1 NfeD family protein [Anaerosacchariphilus polymeriproducens]